MEARSRVIKMLRRNHGESEDSTTEMDDSISRLDKSSCINGLTIVRLMLLWKEHFYNRPSHKGIATLLLEMGTLQQWFILINRRRYVGFVEDQDSWFYARTIKIVTGKPFH